MCKSAILFLSLGLLCSCTRQANVATRSDGQPGSASKAKAAPPPNLFPVKVNDKFGYMDRSGKLVLKAEYAGASRFSDGLAAVQMRKADKVGYIDETGKMVIPIQFEMGDPFSEGLAAVRQNHQWGYIDKTGKLVVPAQYGAVAGGFSEGAAAVAVVNGISATFRFINPKGDFLIKSEFEEAFPYHEGMAAVRSFGEKFKFIDTAGNTVIQPQFTTAGEFSPEGLAPVEVPTTDGIRWGYINKEGKLTISGKFLHAFPFAEGFASVQTSNGGKWGFINPQGTMVIDPKFDQAGSFANGLAQVWVDRGLGYIDTTGKFTWEPK